MLLIAGTIGEGLREPILLVPLETRGDRICNSAVGPIGSSQVLTICSPGVGPETPRGVWEGHWESLWVEAPKAPSAKAIFEDDRAAEAVLTFLRDIKVGRVVTRQEEGEVVEGEDPKNLPFFCLCAS